MRPWIWCRLNRRMDTLPSAASNTGRKKMTINLPSSKPQANVASYLEEFRKLFLQQALSNAIQAVDLRAINEELDRFAPAQDLKKLASLGIRGEFVFALPIILATKPN